MRALLLGIILLSANAAAASDSASCQKNEPNSYQTAATTIPNRPSSNLLPVLKVDACREFCKISYNDCHYRGLKGCAEQYEVCTDACD